MDVKISFILPREKARGSLKINVKSKNICCCFISFTFAQNGVSLSIKVTDLECLILIVYVPFLKHKIAQIIRSP